MVMIKFKKIMFVSNVSFYTFAGYYRVNYEIRLWERIIKALENPERRKDIHPLNRATVSIFYFHVIIMF